MDEALVASPPRLDAALALIRAGAPVNGKHGPGGLTALCHACRIGDCDYVQALVGPLGADANARSDEGLTAMDYALQHEPPFLACALAILASNNYKDINFRDTQWGSTTLMFAAQQGCIESVRRLITVGADVHARQKDRGYSALDFALERPTSNHVVCAVELIKAGVDANAKGVVHSQTTLMHAVQLGLADVVRTLLALGADATIACPVSYKTSLDYALCCKVPKLDCAVELVQARGMSVDAVDAKYGSTTLFFCAQGNAVTLLKRLVTLGANVHRRNNVTGMSALDYALETAPPKLDAAIALIEAGVDVDATDISHGSTTLMHAAQIGSVVHVQRLLELGASVNARNGKTGKSAIDYATEAKPPKRACIRLMQVYKHGAAVEQKTPIPNDCLAGQMDSLKQDVATLKQTLSTIPSDSNPTMTGKLIDVEPESGGVPTGVPKMPDTGAAAEERDDDVDSWIDVQDCILREVEVEF